MKPTPELRLFVRAALTPAFSTGVLAWSLVSLAGVGQAVVGASLVPSVGVLARLCLAALGVGATLALGLAALAGASGAMTRLRDEGAILALASLGLPGRAFMRVAAAWSVPFALCWLAATHVVEPRARAAFRDVRVEAAASVLPLPMRTVHVGAWFFAIDGGRLRFTDGLAVGHAGGWQFTANAGGVLVDLSDVHVQSEQLMVFAERASLPLPISGRGKVHASERTTPELLDQLVRSTTLGRDGYERWLLWKRSLVPLAVVPLAVAAAGLARSWPPAVVVGALLLGTWLLIRVLDAGVASLGVGSASALFVVACGVAAVAGWWRR